MNSSTNSNADVLRLREVDIDPLTSLLAKFRLTLEQSPMGEPIPGSFWGDEEAGLIRATLYARGDTPVHSILHETCHYICMDSQRRDHLDTNAGGDSQEENAVCYLQILLADYVDFMGRKHMFSDMDRWGYSFRLGSAQAWFEQDAEDARCWLIDRGLVDIHGLPRFTLG